MGGLRVLLRVIPVVTITAALAADGSTGSFRQFEDVRGKATLADRSGRWQDARQLWEQAHAIAPDAFQPIASLATLAAKLGQPDEAFAWLEKAYGGCFSDPILGFSDPAYLTENEDYTPLHSDPRWEVLLTRLKAECDEGLLRWRQRQPDLDPQSAPSFKSHRKLATTLDRQRKEYENDRWHLSLADEHTRSSTIRDQRIAALHRYLVEHPKADDRADAAWDAIETRIWPRYVERIQDRWGEFGTQVLEEIDRFLGQYPESSHSGQASLDRAFIAFGVRPESDTEDAAWREEDMLALDRSLDTTVRKYAGTTAGGLALAWRLILADYPSSSPGLPEMRKMKAELDETYGHNRDVQELMAPHLGAVSVRISGIAEFDGTDLSGARWTASTFQGKVTLIHFWATWCGPCVGEIPTIRKAWNAYHDKGLAVLGVSLDLDDRAQFKGWLSRNDVAWPQIWDGKGFSTPLARRYEVRMIPFTVLIGSNGQVTNVNLRGGALVTRIRTLLEASGEAR